MCYIKHKCYIKCNFTISKRCSLGCIIHAAMWGTDESFRTQFMCQINSFFHFHESINMPAFVHIGTMKMKEELWKCSCKQIVTVMEKTNQAPSHAWGTHVKWAAWKVKNDNSVKGNRLARVNVNLWFLASVTNKTRGFSFSSVIITSEKHVILQNETKVKQH